MIYLERVDACILETFLRFKNRIIDVLLSIVVHKYVCLYLQCNHVMYSSYIFVRNSAANSYLYFMVCNVLNSASVEQSAFDVTNWKSESLDPNIPHTLPPFIHGSPYFVIHMFYTYTYVSCAMIPESEVIIIHAFTERVNIECCRPRHRHILNILNVHSWSI